MSKLRPILLLALASVMLSGCLIIDSEHTHRSGSDTVQTLRP